MYVYYVLQVLRLRLRIVGLLMLLQKTRVGRGVDEAEASFVDPGSYRRVRFVSRVSDEAELFDDGSIGVPRSNEVPIGEQAGNE